MREHLDKARLIPARAGNMATSRPSTMKKSAHPRSRGEHKFTGSRVCLDVGSSPLARGTLADIPPRFAPMRLIPARAGNISCTRRQEKHSSGSSPLARGTSGHHFVQNLRGRLIPARAGNMQRDRGSPAPCAAHPRSRGEHQNRFSSQHFHLGSSPLARGTSKS